MINKSNNDGVSKNTSSNFSGVVTFNDYFLKSKENGKSKKFNTPSEIPPQISTNHILGALPDFDIVRLFPHLEFVFLPSGEEIHPADELSRYIYFPETAVVSEVCDLADGNSIETAMVGSDGATGLEAILGLKPPPRRARITIEGNAWRIKTDILKQEFVRAGKLQMLLLDYINRHINQISQRLICKSFHLIEKRLCCWLLMLHDRVKNNQLKLTQENTALLFGAHRPSITLAAQALRGKGLIDYSRGGISILDRQGLEYSACECYSVFHLNHSNY